MQALYTKNGHMKTLRWQQPRILNFSISERKIKTNKKSNEDKL